MMRATDSNATSRLPQIWFLPGIIFLGAIGWMFWPAFGEMAGKWIHDPQYSHGYLVPVFSLVLLYLRRQRLTHVVPQMNWRGLPFLIAGAAGYVTAAYINLDYLAVLSLLPILAGVAMLLGGRPALMWSWPAILFLIFMIPLPFKVERMLGDPLQRVATMGSTWILQTLGYPAFAEGNVIILEHGKIAVVEACSGLSMLLTFAAITTGMAIVLKPPLVDRIVLILSTLPVAVLVNMIRISSNGVAMEEWNPKIAHDLFHDQAGWLMMPLAIGILWFELWVMSRLFVEVTDEDDPGSLIPGLTGRTVSPSKSTGVSTSSS